MRLLLDANLSSKRIGDALRAEGHDVRAVASESELECLEDEAVLELAAADERILVTRNSRDFAPICRHWAEAGRGHAGVILIWSLEGSRFAEIAGEVHAWLDQIPVAAAWRDLVVAL